MKFKVSFGMNIDDSSLLEMVNDNRIGCDLEPYTCIEDVPEDDI